LIFPFILILAVKKIKEFPSLQEILNLRTLSFLSLVGAAGLVARNKLMQLSENILLGFGLSPVTRRNIHILKLPHLPTAPKLFRIIITAISVIGAALVLLYLFEIKYKPSPNKSWWVDRDDYIVSFGPYLGMMK
jgi:hypothetical protein